MRYLFDKSVKALLFTIAIFHFNYVVIFLLASFDYQSLPFKRYLNKVFLFFSALSLPSLSSLHTLRKSNRPAK